MHCSWFLLNCTRKIYKLRVSQMPKNHLFRHLHKYNKDYFEFCNFLKIIYKYMQNSMTNINIYNTTEKVGFQVFCSVHFCLNL